MCKPGDGFHGVWVTITHSEKQLHDSRSADEQKICNVGRMEYVYIYIHTCFFMIHRFVLVESYDPLAI